MYFNHLSRICTGLKKRADVNDIASYFALPPQTFCSWLHTMNYIRNICAHHARLWNRDMNIVPENCYFPKVWYGLAIRTPLKEARFTISFVC
jgi:abortive infection bacteriophage resistance protein